MKEIHGESTGEDGGGAQRSEAVFEWKHNRYDGTLFDAEVSLNNYSAAGKTTFRLLFAISLTAIGRRSATR